MKKFIQLIVVVVSISALLLSLAAQTTANAAPLQSTWNWYNRTAAVAYANKWATSRNPLWWNYTGKGGDCTNFVSQVLNAGGIPEDKSGSTQWYWDNNGVPTVSSSRSASWTGVNELYQYIVTNKQYNGVNGPIGDVNVAREKMEIGDIIQFDWDRNGVWDHSAVVVKTEWVPYLIVFKKLKITVVYHDTDTTGKDLDLLLKSAKARYIKIWGYNAP